MAYAQTNYPNTPLGDGSCGLSIKDAGCYVTADADLLTWSGHPIDPPALNAEYLAKGLFQGGCLISSDTLPRARPSQFALDRIWDSPTDPAPLDLCDTSTDGIYVCVRINYPGGRASDPSHFAPVYDYAAGGPPSSLRIVDSWDGQIKPLQNYGDPATIITAIMRYRALSESVPAPPPATPPPAPVQPPSPVVPFTGNPRVLEGKWIWVFTDEPDWHHLRADLGYDGVLIRAFNGESGATAQAQLAQWATRSAAATAAGLKAVPWTYWYGPGEPGYTEPDPAAYLVRCARATAALGLDCAGWVIDAEAHSLEGLAPALKLLRDLSGKAVFLAPPGDPSIYGFQIDWPSVDASLDGYLPQFYTGAWGKAPTLVDAFADFKVAQKPIYPAGDEQDEMAARAWVNAVRSYGSKGWSYWRAGVGTERTLRAYAGLDPLPTPAPPAPAPQPVPAPPPGPTTVPPPNYTPGPVPPDLPPTPAELGVWGRFLVWLARRLVEWAAGG